MRSLLWFCLGGLAGVLLVGAVLFVYFRFGFAPVSVASAAMPFERYLAHFALHHQTEAAAGDQPPVEASAAHLTAGARLYRDSCAFCHGLPDSAKTPAQRGMFPAPPSLLTGKGVTDDPVGETHWVVRNGIRLTGMPAFERAYSDEQLWEVSLLVAKAHELPAEVMQILRRPGPLGSLQ